MIPLLLQAHTRALTKVIYNHDGDLLFTASKDSKPNVWRTINGERLGSYNGHEGTIWALDVTRDSSILASGSADGTAKLWDVTTGKCIKNIETATGVRSVSWAMGDGVVAILTDKNMGKAASILMYDIKAGQVVSTLITGAAIEKKPTIIKWTDCNEAIVTGHDDGHVALWTPFGGSEDGKVEPIMKVKAHSDTIRDLQFNPDRTYFITASKDTTAKLIETSNLATIKTYSTERPVNSAAISPIRPEVLVAGGQEALNVTTTSSRAGQFEARFFHQIYQNELGRVSGHFGPINTLSYSPTGKGYASGAEDGYVRLHTFDPDYYDFAFGGEGEEEPLL